MHLEELNGRSIGMANTSGTRSASQEIKPTHEDFREEVRRRAYKLYGNYGEKRMGTS